MSTIYNQKPRHESLQYNGDAVMDRVAETINNYKQITGETLTVTEAMDMVKFSFHISDRDAHDEQMAGIAKCLDGIATAIAQGR